MPDPIPFRPRDAWRPPAPEPRSVAELIRTGTLDAELAATLWLLVEARVPLIVAGLEQGAGKTTLLDALRVFLPPEIRVVELAGEREDFAWLPQASELGWPGVTRHHPTDAGRQPVRPDDTVVYAAELSSHLPIYTWGDAARIAIRAASIGYGLLATIHADSLDEVFDELRNQPVSVGDDELSHLGTVLVIRRVDADRRRVVAAHLIRPVARDVHGHLQRLGPAVLATWDADRDAFEHFGWGIIPELAMRTGRRPGDFEIETDRRRDFLTDLVTSGTTAPDDVRRAIAAYTPAV